MRVLIYRIEVENINNNRKHVKLIIYFNFKADIISKELEIDNRKRGTYELSNFYPKKCSSVASKVQNQQYENTNSEFGNLENTGKNANLCSPVTQKLSCFLRTWEESE